MTIRNGSWERDVATVRALAPRLTIAKRTYLGQVLSPITLSLALTFGVVLFTIASYPLWPRMYLSPVLDLFPSLADLFLGIFSSSLAHRAVQVTGGNVFFYLYTAAIVMLFAAYLAALRYARRTPAKPSHILWILATTVLAGILLLFGPTLFTSDLYSYVIYGRIAAAYGANPLVTPPSKFVFDPVYPMVFWKDTVSVYGPVWVSLSYILMAAAPPIVSQQVAIFKAAAILFHLGNTLVIWHILSRLAPRVQLSGTLAYAWNPLLLIEFGGNGHNDVVMLFFMLLSVLAITGERRIQPLVFLVAAALVKWVAILLLPIYLVAVLREEQGWRHRSLYLLRSSAVMAIVAAVIYLPYWSGLATFTTMFDSAAVERFINSFPELMVKPFGALLRDWLPGALARNTTDETAGYLLKGSLAVGFLLFWLREIWRARSSTYIAGSWLRTLFVYLTIASTWFWPWYISWLVPFAILRGWTRLTQATLLFTLSGAFFYSLWPGAPLRPFEPYYDARAAALFGLPLLYLAITAVFDRRRATERLKLEA